MKTWTKAKATSGNQAGATRPWAPPVVVVVGRPGRLLGAAIASVALLAALRSVLPEVTSFVVAPSFGLQPTGSQSTADAPLAGNRQQQSARGFSSASPERGRTSGAAALVALAAFGAAALIVQNKGGGHGEIGYHLALRLASRMKVTMINDSAAKTDKPPFTSYSDLEARGVEIKWADLANGGLAGALAGVGPCDYVFDNQNVCPKDVQEAVKAWNPKAYAYVSSGGMYKPREDKPLIEVGEVKEDNKQLSIERNAAAQGLNWSAYRPQYIYGPKTNKRDYIDWFLDRIVRDLPLPLPVDGSLTTTLTHADDVAGMLASVVGKEDQAKGQVFNCATDVRISHKELAEMIGDIVGKQPKFHFYDPAALKGRDLPKKGKFPFRDTHFGVGVEKAKIILGWKPEHTLKEDLVWYYAEYKRLGKDQGPVPREWDEALLGSGSASAAVPTPAAPAAAPAAVPAAASSVPRRAAALIIQNKGGGHGEIGYHLALRLARRMKVTTIVDSAAKRDSPPFDSYSDLEALGVEVRWADLANGGLSAALAGVEPCDFVFDNQNVCPKDVQAAVAPWSPKAYAYVSSGGMYIPREDKPLIEVGDVKEDNKQLSIERNAAALGLSWSAYRPQYIYGPKTSKRDYIDWFLDRIVRDLPVPLPVDGSLTTTLTHADDVAGMLASVVEQPDRARNQVFNCASDVRISHKDLAELIGSVVGKQPKLVFYDPSKLKGMDIPKKGKFPFRETHFGVGVEKAKIIFGWKPQHDLAQDLSWYFSEYKRLGKDQGPVATDWDAVVLGTGPATASTASPAAAATAAAPTPVAGAPRAPAALIVQNKGGGHGELGYHLALKLARQMKVTMIVDSAAKRDQPPFSSYGDLEALGVEVKWADLANGGLSGALVGVSPCDYVFDNQNICPTDVQDAVAAWAPKAYAYVSSGGMYKPREDKPLIEVGDVKEDNKQLSIERSAAAKGLRWSAFRPQYIYGPKTNKRDYIDWFLDRIVRDLPVPLPVDGTLTTTVTNAADVAGMMASVVGREDAAKGQVFNCATDVRVTHKELAEMIGAAVGKVPKLVFYDPAKLKGVDVPKKGKFPFRETHFGVGVEKAKIILGWQPEHDLKSDLSWYCAEYKRLGKDQGDVARDWDEVVLQSAVLMAA